MTTTAMYPAKRLASTGLFGPSAQGQVTAEPDFVALPAVTFALARRRIGNAAVPDTVSF